MKILHVCAGWGEGNGAANIARLVAGEQRREGHCVECATWPSLRELREADETWVHCGWLPCLWRAAVLGRNVHWMPEACYDPVRLAYHGWKKRLAGPVERRCLRRSAKIVATCEAERGWIRDYVGKGCPPVEVTDVKRFFKLDGKESAVEEDGNADRADRAEGELRLLYLGRRHPLKGVECLEEAVRRVQGAAGAVRPVRLEMVSSTFGEEKERVWGRCDALVLPTLSDNFGLVVAEALERGKRVITTDGAPAWDGGNDYGGRLVYLRGFRDGSSEERVRLLKEAILSLPE